MVLVDTLKTNVSCSPGMVMAPVMMLVELDWADALDARSFTARIQTGTDENHRSTTVRVIAIKSSLELKAIYPERASTIGRAKTQATPGHIWDLTLRT